jgi:3,4-dihydroxy 2-butanone 4-phosphate synthase/GTP cyclohydrolase II
MLCDGRGAGLYKKVLGLELGRTMGLDTSDAYRELGLEQDPRSYERAVEILRHFRIDAVRLLTNNPRKLEGLRRGGITVDREPLEIPSTPESLPYLQTKKLKMGHLLTLQSPET